MSKTSESKRGLVLACFCLLPLVAQGDVSFYGYAKSFAVLQDEISNDLFESDRVWQSQNSLRLRLEGFSDRVVWQVHYELSPVLLSSDQPTPVSTFNVVGDSYRLTDLSSTLNDEDEKNLIYQNLDRLNVQIQLDAGDLTIGRQAISFGSARIINPTDIFLPFDVRTFNTEYRTGVDAIRFQRPWGQLGEIDVGVVLGENADRETSAVFIQLRTNHEGTDYQLALTEFAEQTLIGGGLQTALGDVGFWLEAAWVDGDVDYLRASMGFDYAFTEDTFGQVEYHYNEAGSDEPADYLPNLNTVPYQRGGVFLLGEHYLMPSVTWQMTPLWFVSAQAIVNLSDHSTFFSVAAEYNVAENFYMDFGYYHFSGDDLNVAPAGPELGSEYGSSPDTLYMSLRYYF